MAIALKGKFPITFRAAFELRYRFGFTYLDRCGRTINLIQREYPEWILATEQPTPQHALLLSTDNSCRFSFSSQRLDLAISKPIKQSSISDDDLGRFAEQVEQLASVVIDQLSLDDFSRIGCRIWFLFPFDERQASDDWLRSLGVFSVSPALEAAFGGTLESVSLALVIPASDRKFRIGFETVERTVAMDLGDAVLHVPPHQLPSGKRKGDDPRRDALIHRERINKTLEQNPPFAAMIDVDAAQEEPELVRAGDFVRSSFGQAFDRLKKAIG